MSNAGGSQLTSLDSPDIVPYWARLPKFFLYPFHLGAIALILVSMGLAYVAQYTFFVSVLLWLISIGFVRYGYAVLENTARGHLTPDRLFGADGVDAAYRPYKQWVILALVAVLTAIVGRWLGWWAGALLYLVFMFALPASMMSLGVSDSLFEAINPRVLVSVIAQLGWAYVLLDFFLLMLSGSSGAAFMLIRRWLPPSFALPVFFGLQLYFGLVMFNMIGYVLYQYHDRLGLDVNQPRELRRPEDKERIAQLLDENRVEDALGIAYEAQRRNPDDLEAHDRYHRLLLLANKNDQALSHAQRFIPLLLRQQRSARALEARAACRGIKSDFRLERAADQLELARGAATHRDDRAVMQLLLQFDRHYPDCAEIAGAWLLQAKTMTDRIKQDQPAMQLLRLLIRKYPQAPEAQEAKQYLAVLENMARLKAGSRSV
jgi:tetratricopeptide (TPR) repeat protein